jgi:AraC-like DNA-binding protein
MAAARPLLINTNQTIEQVARSLGYQNACHFSRHFREQHGLPPKTWRKQHQILETSTNTKLQLVKTGEIERNYLPLNCG